jgi:hypothetical protein
MRVIRRRESRPLSAAWRSVTAAGMAAVTAADTTEDVIAASIRKKNIHNAGRGWIKIKTIWASAVRKCNPDTTPAR